jgi:hypothetical protein
MGEAHVLVAARLHLALPAGDLEPGSGARELEVHRGPVRRHRGPAQRVRREPVLALRIRVRVIEGRVVVE